MTPAVRICPLCDQLVALGFTCPCTLADVIHCPDPPASAGPAESTAVSPVDDVGSASTPPPPGGPPVASEAPPSASGAALAARTALLREALAMLDGVRLAEVAASRFLVLTGCHLGDVARLRVAIQIELETEDGTDG